jgi:hypothetical protein
MFSAGEAGEGGRGPAVRDGGGGRGRRGAIIAAACAQAAPQPAPGRILTLFRNARGPPLPISADYGWRLARWGASRRVCGPQTGLDVRLVRESEAEGRGGPPRCFIWSEEGTRKPRLAETPLGGGAPAPSPAAIRRSRPLRRPPALWLRHEHADTRRMRALLAIVACLALTSLAVAEIEFHTLQVGTRRGPSCCVEAGQGGLACGSP